MGNMGECLDYGVEDVHDIADDDSFNADDAIGDVNRTNEPAASCATQSTHPIASISAMTSAAMMDIKVVSTSAIFFTQK